MSSPHIEDFGKRGGFGRRPALAIIDMTLTDPESPWRATSKSQWGT